MSRLIPLVLAILFLSGGPASARYYEASTGRFLQEDPILLPMPVFTNTQSVNKYNYVESNPINRVDPLGLFSFDPQEFAALVEQRNFSNVYTLLLNSGNAGANYFFTYPRSGLGGNPAGYPSTWQSAVGSEVKIKIPFRVFGTTNAFRAIGRASVVWTIFEGFYDLGTIGVSAYDATTFFEPEKTQCPLRP